MHLVLSQLDEASSRIMHLVLSQLVVNLPNQRRTDRKESPTKPHKMEQIYRQLR